MVILPVPVNGARLVEIEPKEDVRGFFARTWCREEFRQAGIDVEIVQASVSHNERTGTLRGLHFAWPPSSEAKLVRCERGRIFDAIVDLRPDSPTFLASYAVELDERRKRALFIPSGVAHGFQTLADDCDVLYMMSDVYRPELADGVAYDDPAFAVAWPRDVTVIADRDRAYPRFDIVAHRMRFADARARSRSSMPGTPVA